MPSHPVFHTRKHPDVGDPIPIRKRKPRPGDFPGPRSGPAREGVPPVGSTRGSPGNFGKGIGAVRGDLWQKQKRRKPRPGDFPGPRTGQRRNTTLGRIV